MIIIIMVAAVVAVVGIVILAGKGDWLIAGYNTSSPEEREKYDIRRLRLLMGGSPYRDRSVVSAPEWGCGRVFGPCFHLCGCRSCHCGCHPCEHLGKKVKCKDSLHIVLNSFTLK